MTTPLARFECTHEGRIARLTLAAPKANILDRSMIAALDGYLETLLPRRDLHAVVIAADGPHFSFGASIEEHLPDQIAGTLGALHGLLRRLVDVPAPTIAAVRGQCLGGGLELVLACDLVIAEETAQLGCPEIKLGVFPPAASALLPARIGASAAALLTLTGDSIGGMEAAARGLVARTVPAGQLAGKLDAWLEETFVPRTSSGLRYAALAARPRIRRAIEEDLPALERLYLDHLMHEPDALDGIRAFLDRRRPVKETTA